MARNPLGLPVSALMRPTPAVSPEDSLARVGSLLAEVPFGALPVTRGGRFVGAVTHRSLARALASGSHDSDPIAGALDHDVPSVSPNASGAEVWRLMESLENPWIVVVDESGTALGMIGVSDLFFQSAPSARPSAVGGMATPFGVYLTTGSVRAGAGDFALISTGALLFGMFLASVLVAELLARWLSPAMGGDVAKGIRDAAPLVLFMIGLRAIPLSGTHAAEHKVVHAIERGEPLVLDVVRRMPRVHPRCGTNLAVGASLLLGLANWPWIPWESVRLLVALLVTLIAWRPLGNLAQFLVTTKPPTDRQLLGAIRAGEELLEAYAVRGRFRPRLMRRLWMSGLFHVVAGSILAMAIVELFAWAFGLQLLVQV